MGEKDTLFLDDPKQQKRNVIYEQAATGTRPLTRTGPLLTTQVLKQPPAATGGRPDSCWFRLVKGPETRTEAGPVEKTSVPISGDRGGEAGTPAGGGLVEQVQLRAQDPESGCSQLKPL